MRVHLSRQRLLLVTGFLGLGAATVFWAHRGSLPTASAQVPSAQAPAPVQQIPPAASTDYSHRAVAYIYGTEPITREELGEYLIARVGEERLGNLINKRIIEHYCREKGIEVTPAETKADLAETLKGLNLQASDFEKQVLKPYKKTLYEYMEDNVKPRLLLTKLCRDRVQVTDEDVRLAFEAYYGEKVECRMIMWRQDERKNVEKIYTQLRDSEAEFDKAATMQWSRELATSGGRLKDPIGHHTTGNDELEKVAFNLQPGQLSRLLEVPQGLVVLKCVKRIPPNTSVKVEQVRDKLTKEVVEKKLQQEIRNVFTELEKKANPQKFLARTQTEEDLLREVRQELESDPAKPGVQGRAAGKTN
jgi:hypothetical protein